MWGYHIGATIADAAYGMSSSSAYIQSGSGQARWRYNGDIPGKSSYWEALENFDPNWMLNLSRWMPLGVLHDLMDDRVESNGESVNENVSGYTQQKFFNALQSDVISIPVYKDRLLQQNNNNQQSAVDILFQSYGY